MILFVHGWGYDASFWDPLRGALGDRPSTALDLGYFGTANMIVPDGVTLLVGHSLGFLWLVRQRGLEHLPLIGVNAFPRFLECDDYRPAVAPRLLERMRRRVAADPNNVLAEFWQRAGAPGPSGPPDAATLAEGLDHLASWDERENLARRASPVRLIAGDEDAIVPAAMAQMAFKNFAVDWLSGGHALPRSHPAQLAAWIVRVSIA
ncbi:MAG TPA: alpha/beta fold hydrolase [Dongiaceae bacterium]|nr:alpha/beta fold hydrolase [Dongiaceae bacterium]